MALFSKLIRWVFKATPVIADIQHNNNKNVVLISYKQLPTTMYPTETSAPELPCGTDNGEQNDPKQDRVEVLEASPPCCKDEWQDEPQDQWQDQWQDESQDQWQDQRQDKWQDESQDQWQDEPQDQWQDKSQDQWQDECQDQWQDESQDQWQGERQDQWQDESQDQWQDEYRHSEADQEIYFLRNQLVILRNRLQKKSFLLFEERKEKEAARNYCEMYWADLEKVKETLKNETSLHYTCQHELNSTKLELSERNAYILELSSELKEKDELIKRLDPNASSPQLSGDEQVSEKETGGQKKKRCKCRKNGSISFTKDHTDKTEEVPQGPAPSWGNEEESQDYFLPRRSELEVNYLRNKLDEMKNRLQRKTFLLFKERNEKLEALSNCDMFWEDLKKLKDDLRKTYEQELSVCKNTIADLQLSIKEQREESSRYKEINVSALEEIEKLKVELQKQKIQLKSPRRSKTEIKEDKICCEAVEKSRETQKSLFYPQ